MAILPLQLARVSNQLRTSVSQNNISRTQQQLLQVQNQLATGKRLSVPSDAPGDAALVQQVRKALEQRIAFANNIRAASRHLAEVDTTLGEVADLLLQAQTIASANVGSDVTAEQRLGAAEVVKALYSQVLGLANRRSDGVYLFAGDRSTQQPFVEAGGGVRFVGTANGLRNFFGENALLPFMENGAEIFGAYCGRVLGSQDLTPALTASTRLADLRGARGAGIALGAFDLSNGTASATIDLSGADNVQDVIDRINAAGVGSITASIAPGGAGLLLSAGPADDITVTERGGTAAADLGILTTTGGGAGVNVTGQALGPRLTLFTPLAALRGGSGIDTTGLAITNGAASATIDLSAVANVEGLLNAINGADLGVWARINDDGTGIDIVNLTQGTAMQISEAGGTTATDLGVRSFSPATPLAQLNNGSGVRTVTGADIRITRADGTSFEVDLSGLGTVQDVIDAINAADGGGGMTASFASTGNGIVLTDTTGGSGAPSLTSVNFSPAARDLGLDGTWSGTTLTGSDVNSVESAGVLGNLAKLIAALQASDPSAITRASEGLSADYQRLVNVRGRAGARLAELESRKSHLEDQDLAARSLLSSLEDVDFNEAVSRFQTLQLALQANFEMTGRMLNLNLLDFLR